MNTRIVNGVARTGEKVRYTQIFDENGKIQPSLIPQGYDNIEKGYLHEGVFYAKFEGGVYSEPYTPQEEVLYIDKADGHKYLWNGTAYEDYNADIYEGLAGKVAKSDIIDNLESTDSDKPISARAVNVDMVDFIDESITATMLYIDQQDNSEHAGRVAGDNLLEEKKANKDGYYQTLSAGYADKAGNLVDTKGEGTPQTFVRRTSCGDDSIADDGTALIKKVQGNTIVWNQKIQTKDGKPYTSTTYNRWTIDVTGDVFKATYKITGTDSFYESGLIFGIVYNWKLTVGHKYYALLQAKGENIPDGLYIGFRIRGSGYADTCLINLSGDYQTRRVIATSGYANNLDLYFNERYTADTLYGLTLYIKRLLIIDLTKMFGAGNEPTTVEEFEAMFPLDYYPYNAGQLLSLKADGIVTDGFNQFDGTKAKVFGGKAYYINGTYATLKFAKTIDGVQTDITPSANLYTPTEDGYIFATGVSANFNINLSWGGYRNGEYEPYWKETKALPTPASGLKSCGSGANIVRDEMTASKDIIRVGTRAYQEGDENDATLTTDGTNTNYPLAEPVEIDYESPRNFIYRVADFGTEEISPLGVDEQGVPKSAPFLGQIKYSDDFTRQLVNMPKNYIGKGSMDAILTALQSAGIIGGYTLTWDSTNGKYNCVITAPTPEPTTE